MSSNAPQGLHLPWAACPFGYTSMRSASTTRFTGCGCRTSSAMLLRTPHTRALGSVATMEAATMQTTATMHTAAAMQTTTAVHAGAMHATTVHTTTMHTTMLTAAAVHGSDSLLKRPADAWRLRTVGLDSDFTSR